jgi:hypothetical protein
MIPTADQVILQLISPNLETGPWIAGGAAMHWFNGGTISSIDCADFPTMQDIDVFFASEAQYNSVKSKLGNLNLSKELPFTSNNADTFKFISIDNCGRQSSNRYWKVQLIKRSFFNSVTGVLDTFDFVCCGFATDGKKYVTLPNAAKDLNKKVLNIHRYTPESAVSRTVKYWAYGFKPSADLINRITNDSNVVTNFAGYTDYDHAF